MPQFFTKSGWLTPYALACGYIHKTDLNDHETVRLSARSCGDYEVEHYNREASGVVSQTFGNLRAGLSYAEAFDTIAEARRAYQGRVKRLRWRFERNPEINRNVIC